MLKELRKHIPLLQKHSSQLPLTFLDVGSRNGVLELDDIASLVEAHGFEPNPEEYKKLVDGNTDRKRILGKGEPSYKNLKYNNLAAGDRDGESSFFVTAGPGAAGVLPVNFDTLNKIAWKGKKYKKSFGADIFGEPAEIKVNLKKLDSYCNENNIKRVDYLKIDVEGFEYSVLQGAENILENTLVIKCEVCNIPFRKDQKLYGDVDVYLRKLGFRLVNFEIFPDQVGYRERTSPVFVKPKPYRDPYGAPLSFDAIYMKENVSENLQLNQAFVLMEKHYLDDAAHLIKPLLEKNPELRELYQDLVSVQAYSTEDKFGLRNRLYEFADKFTDLIRKI